MILLHNLQILAYQLDTCPYYGAKIKYLNRVCVYTSFYCTTKISYKEDIPIEWLTKLVPIKSRLVNRMPHI